MQNNDIWDQIEQTGFGEHLDEEMFEYISAYCDGECAPKERRLVEAYLSENPQARALLADLRSQTALLTEGSQDPPAWLRESILNKTVKRTALKWPIWAGTAAAAAACTVGFLLFAKFPAPARSGALAANTGNPRKETQVLPARPPKVSKETAQELVDMKKNPGRESLKTSAPRVVQAVYSPGNKVEAEAEPSAAAKQPPSAPKANKVVPPANVPAAYASVDYAAVGRAQPAAPDPVPMASQQETQESMVAEGRKEEGPVMTDAREKLRSKLKKLNDEQKDEAQRDLKKSFASK